MKKNSVAPIIIIGSHRAGTSMICRVLEDLGVFMGWKKDSNNESDFFIKLNQWMLTSSSANWDSPENVQYIFKNNDLFYLTFDYINKIVKSPHLIEYLGISKYLKYRNLDNLNFIWGWKDPRNTFTLPLWLKMFPEAKVIHVYRHGVDVAQSLYYRNNKGIQESKNLHKKRSYLYQLIKKKGGFTGSNLCFDFEKCFEIWHKYIAKSFEYESTIENNIMHIKYEDFLSKPDQFVHELLNFCGLKVSTDKVLAIGKSVKPDRAYAYKNVPELLSFADKEKDTLKEFNY
jgi:hypothetical protein